MIKLKIIIIIFLQLVEDQNNGGKWQDTLQVNATYDCEQGSSSSSSPCKVSKFESSTTIKLIPTELQKDKHTALRYLSYGIPQSKGFRLEARLAKFKSRKVGLLMDIHSIF